MTQFVEDVYPELFERFLKEIGQSWGDFYCLSEDGRRKLRQAFVCWCKEKGIELGYRGRWRVKEK